MKSKTAEFSSSIAVIDPGVKRAEVESFNVLSLRSPFPLTYHLPALAGMSSLDPIGESLLKGIILFGSASSVHDRFQWQKELGDWLVKQWKSSVPTLAICFGHQFVATLFGGEVGYLFPDRSHRLGLFELKLRNHPFFENRSTSGLCFSSHQEVVNVCPKDFEVVGSSEAVPIEALCHRTLPIWTFQCHPEATPQFLTKRGHSMNGRRTLQFGESILDAFFRKVAHP